MIAWAQPERFVTLTQAPDSWQAVRQRMRTLTMRVRRAGYRCEWAWTVEKGAKTGMVHIHALQHGSYVPQAALQDLWGRIVHVRAIRGARSAAGYAMKEAGRVAGYAMKGTHAQLLDHLDLNGGRGCHLSRGYLRGKRTREVEQLLTQGQETLTWVLVPAVDTIDEATDRLHRVHRDGGLPS